MIKRYITLSAFILLNVAANQAQTSKLVKQMADADSARLVGIFKDIHQNPELAFQETRTAGIVAKEFKTLGYEIITGMGITGVAGILRNGEGPVVMYRSEMDCNAVKEITSLPYASTKTRDVLLDGIKRINAGIAIANNLPKELFPTIKMKGFVYPLENNSEMVTKINISLAELIDKSNIISNKPSSMGSEDFHHLVFGNKRTVYDYMRIGIANGEVFSKAVKEGKTYPFYNHNGNYEVDLSAIPLGTKIGAIAVLDMFRK